MIVYITDGVTLISEDTVSEDIGLAKKQQDTLKFALRKLLAGWGRVPSCFYAETHLQEGLNDQLYASLSVYDQQWQVRTRLQGNFMPIRVDVAGYRAWREEFEITHPSLLHGLLSPDQLVYPILSRINAAPINLSSTTMLSTSWLQMVNQQRVLVEGAVPNMFVLAS